MGLGFFFLNYKFYKAFFFSSSFDFIYLTFILFKNTNISLQLKENWMRHITLINIKSKIYIHMSNYDKQLNKSDYFQEKELIIIGKYFLSSFVRTPTLMSMTV